MKNTGRIITAVMLTLLLLSSASAAEIKTELTDSRIGAGDSTVLKIMISGTTSNIRPLKVPAVDGLNIVMSGSSRSFQFINGKTWTGVILNFTIQSETKGVYRIPPFIIEADGERLESREVVLTVAGETRGVEMSAGAVRGEVELSATDVYAGEPVLMRYYIKGASSDLQVEGIKEQPAAKGFVIKPLKEQDIHTQMNGSGVSTHVASYCLVAADSGRHEIGGGTVVALVETDQGFFTRAIRREIKFPRRSINVKPLPSAGRPENFRGDVGEFTITAGEISGSYRAGDEIRIPVTVKGRGNLLMLSKPSVENQDGMKILVEEKEPLLSVDERTTTGEKEFTVTVIPVKEGRNSIGKIYLQYFNPYRGAYEKAETAPFSFDVTPSAEKSEDSAANVDGSMKWNGPYLLLILALTVVAAGAVMIILQLRKYRPEKKTPAADITPDAEVKTSDKKNGLSVEIESAYAGRDRESFLLYADRLSRIADGSILSAKDKEELGVIREQIHLCRYGGGELSDDQMENIYRVLRRITG